MAQENVFHRLSLLVELNIGTDVTESQIESAVKGVLCNLGGWSINAAASTVSRAEMIRARLETPLSEFFKGVDSKGFAKSEQSLFQQGLRNALAILALGSRKLGMIHRVGRGFVDLIAENLATVCPSIPFYPQPPIGLIAAICQDTNRVPVQAVMNGGQLDSRYMETRDPSLAPFTVADVLANHPELMDSDVLGESVVQVRDNADKFNHELVSYKLKMARRIKQTKSFYRL